MEARTQHEVRTWQFLNDAPESIRSRLLSQTGSRTSDWRRIHNTRRRRLGTHGARQGRGRVPPCMEEVEMHKEGSSSYTISWDTHRDGFYECFWPSQARNTTVDSYHAAPATDAHVERLYQWHRPRSLSLWTPADRRGLTRYTPSRERASEAA